MQLLIVTFMRAEQYLCISTDKVAGDICLFRLQLV